jgi:hypothetical protein
MQARYQNGCLTTITRKDEIERWQFRWRSRHPDGSLRPCKKTIGPVNEYPINSKKLQDLLLGLRMKINIDPSARLGPVTIAALVDHFERIELAEPEDEESGRAHSTRSRLKWLLHRWVIPRWGKLNINDVKPVAVEHWLGTLKKETLLGSERLARGTRAKIRNAMSALYNHAIRWEFIDRNPITGPVKGSGVRVSAKRMSIPDILTIDEMQKMISAVRLRERVLIFLDMVTGLHRGELAGLKWADIDFLNLQINVSRLTSSSMWEGARRRSPRSRSRSMNILQPTCLNGTGTRRITLPPTGSSRQTATAREGSAGNNHFGCARSWVITFNPRPRS